jgi:hypothetical protein
MKLSKELVTALIILGVVVISVAFADSKTVKAGRVSTSAGDTKGFALVELFTSEGCSSCPPADALVAKMLEENPQVPIYLMAYHVDYWDRGGWKDAFSDPNYSRRQEQYGDWLHLSTIYTPQIVVNGKAELVGSDGTALFKAVSARLRETPAQSLTMISTVVDGKINIAYQTNAPLGKYNMVIGLIQKSGQSKVIGGENSGMTLDHVQIVRKLSAEPLSMASGRLNLALPRDYKAKEWEVIAFVQDKASGAVLAAARCQLL